MNQLVGALVNSIAFSVLGMGIFGAGFWVFDRLMPGQLFKEIIEEHNTALAVLMGSIAIGISLIIGFAIHG
jgi:uncharacterized membrane protein YjfL (UPF0719 family)